MNYKKVMPIFLAVALFGTAAFSIRSRLDVQSEFKEAVTEARSYAELGIEADSISAYQRALKVKPDLQLYSEAGELLLEKEDYDAANQWYRKMRSSFPEEADTYLFGIKMAVSQENYRKAFEVYDEYLGRSLDSKEVEEEMDEIRYLYSLTGNFDEVKPFGSASQIAAVKHDEVWGYVDRDLSYAIPFEYQEADAFSEFAAAVDQKGNAVYLDEDGNVRINQAYVLDADPSFKSVKKFGPMQSNLILAYNGSVWNYYEKDTAEKLCGGFKEALPIAGGVGAAAKSSSEWALIDRSGKELTKYRFTEVLADGKGIIARSDSIIVKENNKYFLVDYAGNKVSKAEYDDARPFLDNTYAAVKSGKKWSFIDASGETKLTVDCQDAQSFSYGLAAIKKGGKWGYIDMEGNLVIPCIFEEANPFYDHGVTFVKGDTDTWQLLKLYLYNH